MNTTENNALIAEFMGYEKVLSSYHLPQHEQNGQQCFYDSELRFHSSWDWVQPCVAKAMDTEHPDKNAHMKLNDAWLTMNIEEVYNEIVNFIVTLQA